jgi:hypothetical protein
MADIDWGKRRKRFDPSTVALTKKHIGSLSRNAIH